MRYGSVFRWELKETDLANKVCIVLLVFFKGYGVPPDILSAIVGFPDTLELRYDVAILLLGEVLIECQGVVLFFGFTAFALAAWLVSVGGRRSRCGFGIDGGSCLGPGIIIGRSSVNTPVIGSRLGTPSIVICGPLIGAFSGGVIGGSLLNLELCVAIVATPRLVDLLIRIAVDGLNIIGAIKEFSENDTRPASPAVPVKLATTATPTRSAATSAPTAASAVVIVWIGCLLGTSAEISEMHVHFLEAASAAGGADASSAGCSLLEALFAAPPRE